MNTMQNHDTRVPDTIGSLSELDILAIQQYSDHQGTSGRQPEKSLMSAVLLDAVECFQKYLLFHDEYENRLFREAENWILDNDREWLFSFTNICDALSIDPHYFRKGLLRWKQHAMHSVSTRERNKRSA
jgi:hypothetical protein